MKAICIKQPWAWLIVHGYKPVENRSWNTHYRGRFYIVASKNMSRPDYEACRIFVAGASSVELPDFHELKRLCGGIVGEAEIYDSVTKCNSTWFTGDFGWLLRNPKILPFRPVKGQLNWFNL